MATPPFGAPGDKIIITIAGAQLNYRANKEVSVINSLRGVAITRIVYEWTDGQTDGQTDNGASHKLDWSRPVELKTIFLTFSYNLTHLQ